MENFALQSVVGDGVSQLDSLAITVTLNDEVLQCGLEKKADLFTILPPGLTPNVVGRFACPLESYASGGPALLMQPPMLDGSRSRALTKGRSWSFRFGIGRWD
jgi:hypothetical protein